MPTFSNRPIGRPQSRSALLLARLTPQVRKHPVMLFGLPFVVMIVASSFGLSYMTQTRYDYNSSKVKSMSMEEELGMRKDRRKIDIREEYFRLQAKDSEMEDWEPKRIPRPEGMEEPLAPKSRTLRMEGDSSSDEKENAFSSMGSPSSRKVILDKDGKPCRACNSRLAFSAAMKMKPAQAKSDSRQEPNSVLPAATTADQTTDSNTTSCPPDGETLGQSTWAFLHSAAAYYPNSPSDSQQSAMLSLIQALPHVYPCHTCAESLKEELERERRTKKSWEDGAPLRDAVRSGKGFRKWLCGLHNEVNVRLGKPTWPCTEEALQQRWKDGPSDGRCD